jgi:hypothetical protein
MDREVEAVKTAILSSGLDDWVHMAEVVSAARQARSEGASDEGSPDDSLAKQERAAFPLGIAAIKELLRDGLVRVGETTPEGFVAWRGSADEIESRIDSVAQQAEFPLLPGHLFWIENTPSGDEVARSILGISG